MNRILVTGAGGAIGAMVKRHFTAAGIAWQDAGLRAGPDRQPVPEGCTTLLHLANEARDIGRNIALQRKVAEFIAGLDIATVIVPQSYSTLARADGGPDPECFNFGLAAAMNDPYPQGKLAVEAFWTEWQAAHPHARVVFAYIPAIVGPDSKWSAMVRAAGNGGTLMVPRIGRFAMVRQHELVEAFARMHRAPHRAGIERVLMARDMPSLARAASFDHPGSIREFEVRGWMRALCAAAERSSIADRLLLALIKLVAIALPRLSGRALLPLSPRYLALFLRQDELAGTVDLAGAPSRPEPAHLKAG